MAVVEQRYRVAGSRAIEKGAPLQSRGEDFMVSKGRYRQKDFRKRREERTKRNNENKGEVRHL